MARINPRFITADMVDSGSFTVLSTKFSVMSVPMTVVNGREHVVGAVPEGRLLALVQQAF